MAITRRQFVTRVGAFAAAAGLSTSQIAGLAKSFAGNDGVLGDKPRVVWLHGAECTGCSVSLLSFYENLNGDVYGTGLDTGTALRAAGVTHDHHGTAVKLRGDAADTGAMADVVDIVLDVIDLQYHETIMGMGGDLAGQWLKDLAKGTSDAEFVLVVEGAVQDYRDTGAWESEGHIPWCSVGATNNADYEAEFGGLIVATAEDPNCVAIVAVGQCASFGGYPGCKPQITEAPFDVTQSQTNAMGVKPYLEAKGDPPKKAWEKVYNAPGCPANPWWFALTVVALMVKLNGGPDLTASVDKQGRISAVYPAFVHGPMCPRYQSFVNSKFAKYPGDAGCLRDLGCKGLYTKSLCGLHGWNNRQPENKALALGGGCVKGGHCPSAGAPCMGCTEQGYPDSFVPFVTRRA